MSNLITHKPDALIIAIPTSCPAALQEQLLKGISQAIQYYIDSPDKQGSEIASLLYLQACLTPNELQLEKAYAR